MSTLQDVRLRVDQWFHELSRICGRADPWGFLCLSALVDYLAKLAAGTDLKRAGYIRFVGQHFPSGYGTFRYRGGQRDLPEQMYHVLRCGIVHSFSLIPDGQSRKHGGRDRSIALEHAAEAWPKGHSHLCNYAGPNNLDAALLVCEEFYADVKWAADELLRKAASNPCLEQKITSWFAKYPPISGGF